MGYRYNGKQFDAHEPWPTLPDRRTRTRGPAEHGTRSGYIAHQNKKEAACEPCVTANREYQAAYKQRRKLAA